MGRFERQGTGSSSATVVVDGTSEAELRQRLAQASDALDRYRARVAILEAGLAEERSARLEAGAMLASERLRAREAEEGGSSVSNERLSRELERAWRQIHALQDALTRESGGWWRRRSPRLPNTL